MVNENESGIEEMPSLQDKITSIIFVFYDGRRRGLLYGKE
jgi:hypothetical protein